MMEWTVPFWVWAIQFISWIVMFGLWFWMNHLLKKERQRPDRIDEMVEFYASYGVGERYIDLKLREDDR